MRTSDNAHRIDVDITGTGPALFLLHGWPFHRATFRKVVPLLADAFTCYSFNSVGMAFDGRMTPATGMNFEHHADRLLEWADQLGIGDFSILAHDTGATIARLAASTAGDRVRRLVLLNTEMPNHRPPFIPMYQRLLKLPGSRLVMQILLSAKSFRRSAMGFGGAFSNLSAIEGEFASLFADYWFEHPTRFEGMVRYLTGLDFAAVDALPDIHARLQSPVLFVWGADDVTFPCVLGEAMASSMPTCSGFHRVSKCAFLPQEEHPEIVAQHVRRFVPH
ncbi:MAG: alpha/beta hydrolase [Pseudomonadota bacterium]